MSDQPTHPAGYTFFLRCAHCRTPYVVNDGFSWRTGQAIVCWVRPPVRRKPVPCDHLGGVQAWNGTAWIDAVVEARDPDREEASS